LQKYRKKKGCERHKKTKKKKAYPLIKKIYSSYPSFTNRTSTTPKREKKPFQKYKRPDRDGGGKKNTRKNRCLGGRKR